MQFNRLTSSVVMMFSCEIMFYQVPKNPDGSSMPSKRRGQEGAKSLKKIPKFKAGEEQDKNKNQKAILTRKMSAEGGKKAEGFEKENVDHMFKSMVVDRNSLNNFVFEKKEKDTCE